MCQSKQKEGVFLFTIIFVQSNFAQMVTWSPSSVHKLTIYTMFALESMLVVSQLHGCYFIPIFNKH